MLVALNNRERTRIFEILHNEPREGFFVLAVDLRSLLQLSRQLADGDGVIFGVEVDNDCVDHCCEELGESYDEEELWGGGGKEGL